MFVKGYCKWESRGWRWDLERGFMVAFARRLLRADVLVKRPVLAVNEPFQMLDNIYKLS